MNNVPSKRKHPSALKKVALSSFLVILTPPLRTSLLKMTNELQLSGPWQFSSIRLPCPVFLSHLSLFLFTFRPLHFCNKGSQNSDTSLTNSHPRKKIKRGSKKKYISRRLVKVINFVSFYTVPFVVGKHLGNAVTSTVRFVPHFCPSAYSRSSPIKIDFLFFFTVAAIARGKCVAGSISCKNETSL